MAKVLIVDRVASVREALGMVLELEGHEVAQTSTASEALQLAADWRPHAVMADTNVDGMPLGSFCAAMRTTVPGISLVVTSLRPASCTPLDACPGAAFLTKPFTSAEMLEALSVAPRQGV